MFMIIYKIFIFFLDSVGVPLHKTIKGKLYFAFISLDVIFTIITWKERGYIYTCLTGYTEKGSETMTDLLDKVENVFKELSKMNREYLYYKKELWTLLSLKNLK